MNVLAIDPGFDDTGIAVFGVSTPPQNLCNTLRLIVTVQTLSTPTHGSDAARLASLGLRIRNLVLEWDPAVTYVELPAFEGSYTGGKERRKGVNRLYMSLGAILSRLGSGVVVPIPASRMPKAQRHELLANAARIAGVELPEGPRGGVREDAWDAVWLGATALLERGARDLPRSGFIAPKISGIR